MVAVVKERSGHKVDVLYGLMQSYENKLGGGEGIEGLYGSITQTSMQKVLDCLKHNSGLDNRSVFVDIGAGLGRPMLHALVSIGVASAWGVELDRVKCDKAAAFCEHVLHQMVLHELLASTVTVPPVICSPVEKVMSLDPATHAYSFWEGVPPSGKQAFGELFASSRTLRAVAVVQRAIRGEEPAAMMREYGFGPVLLIASFPVKMSGSGRSFTAYVFTKIAPAAANFLANATGGAAGAAAATIVTPPCGKLPLKTASAGGKAVLQKQMQLVSPSKARKPDGEPGQASPPKKPCAGAGGGVVAGSGEDAAPSLGAAGRAKAVQQVLLTSLPDYSRRTKQGTTVAAGKQAGGGGRGAANKAAAVTDKPAGALLKVIKGQDAEQEPAAARRSSRRLAAKALASVAVAAQIEGC